MIRFLLAGAAWALATGLLVLPIAALFAETLRHGLAAALTTFAEPDTVSAIELTGLVTLLTVPLNTVLGITAAYALTRFDFPGRAALSVLIELPLSISPVVSGLIWVLVFGAQGWFGPWLSDHGIRIIFAVPGIVLATMFVTLPFVARTLMPAMEARGRAHEEAATMLGAGFLDVLLRVTLPGVRLAMVSGVLLCTARTLGEFGAVSVVSGNIPGQTETVPLRIQTLYDDYQTVSAFALAAFLAILSGSLMALNRVVSLRRTTD